MDVLSGAYPSHSPYNYALNDPLSLNDPTGTCPEDGSAGPNQYGPGECLAAVVVTARHPDRPTLGRAIGQGFAATLPVAGTISQLDTPVPGPADLVGALVQVIGTAVVAHDVYTNWQRPPNVVLPPSILQAASDDPLDNPQSLEGLTPREVADRVPDGWVASPTRSGDGVRYHPASQTGQQIRVMPGAPGDPNPMKRGPYAQVSNGRGPVV